MDKFTVEEANELHTLAMKMSSDPKAVSQSERTKFDKYFIRFEAILKERAAEAADKDK